MQPSQVREHHSESPSFWPLLHSLALEGRAAEAWGWLQLHSRYQRVKRFACLTFYLAALRQLNPQNHMWKCVRKRCVRKKDESWKKRSKM